MRLNSQLWLGTESSVAPVILADQKVQANHANQLLASSCDPMEREELRNQLVQVVDGVAIINIRGSLVSGSAGWGLFYGIVGYDDLRAAEAWAVSNPAVVAIVRNVDSGGGAVMGVSDQAQFMSRVSKVKPTVTYAAGMMCSAALWTGVQSEYVIASDVSIVGSLGVLSIHAERSKMLEEMGVKVTVIRAGEKKALANAYEPLTDEAKKDLEVQAAELYDVFLPSVATARGVSTTVAEAKFGKGVTFVGKAAVAAGLVDKIGTLEDAVAKAQSLAKAKAKTGPRATNSSRVQAATGDSVALSADNAANTESTHMPKPFTAEQLAAMAAGVDMPDADDASATNTAPAADAAPAGNAPVAAEPPAASTVDAMNVLQGMLADAQGKVGVLTAQLEAAKASADANKTTFEAAMTIARKSVQTMGLHFGVNKDSVAAMSDTEVLAEHTRLSGLFTDKFKTGGVAAVGTSGAKPEPSAQVNPLFVAAAQSNARGK